MKTIIFLTSLLLICTTAIFAESAKKKIILTSNYEIPHFENSLSVDGILEETQWNDALIIELGYETKPGENTAAPVRTIAYLYEDGENINVAFRAFDHDVSKIRAHYHDHDYIFDDDIVGFKVDTANDGLYSYQFFLNALGVKHDSIEDGEAGEDDLSWNAIWDAAAKLTDEGFTAEFSIPFRILRFDDSKDIQKWGFDVLRFYPRKHIHRLSHRKVDRSISCNLCQNSTISGMKDIEQGKNLSVVPFLTSTSNEYRSNPHETWNKSSADVEIGADVRWGVSADTTLNATFKPDFSQVESDVAQLDINNAFSLFYPEKRPFFVEGADYYKSMMNLVHTRNISNPDVGAKITHSSNGNNFAAFMSDDIVTNFILPSSTSSQIASLNEDSVNTVLRYRKDLENTSTVGAMMTLRKSDNYHNYLYGIDGSFRLTDTDVIRAQLVNTETEDADIIYNNYGLASKKSDGSAIDLHYRHKDRDWIWWGRYTKIEEGFRADLGFQPRVNYDRYTTGIRRYWYANTDHWWHTISLGFDTRNLNELDGGTIERWFNSTLSYEGPLQSKIELNMFLDGEQYWEGETYDNREIILRSEIVPVPGLELKFSLSSIESIDYIHSRAGDLLTINPAVKFNLGEHFQTEIQYTKQSMDVDGGELFTTNLIDARLIYQFSVQSYLRLVVQYDDTKRNQKLHSLDVNRSSKDIGSQLLYSYKINPQTVFYLGYSDNAFKNDDFRHLSKTDKTLFMKMSYSWLY